MEENQTEEGLPILKKGSDTTEDGLPILKKKVDSAPIPSSSVVGTSDSESTESPSVSEAPSISKTPSKEDNISTIKAGQIDALKTKTRDQFVSNPIFADSNPNAQRNRDIYINNLKSKGYSAGQINDLKLTADKAIQSKRLVDENGPKVNQNPNDADAAYKTAVGLTGMGKYDDAINLFNATLGHLKPDEEGPANSTQQAGMSSDIQTQKSAAANPSNSLYGIGYALSSKKDYKGSVDYYNQAIEADPNNVNAQKGLAYSKSQLGLKDEARQHLKEAQKIEQSNQANNALVNQINEETAGDKAQQQESDQMKGIADALEAFVSGNDPEGKLGNLGYLNPVAKWYDGVIKSSKSLGQSLKELYDVSHLPERFDPKAPGLKTAALDVVIGAGNTAFSAIPAVTAFNTGVAAIKESAKVLPESGEKIVNTVLDFPFQATSMTAKALGYNPEDGSDAKKMLELADIVASFGTMHLMHAGAEEVVDHVSDTKSSINDLKEISKQAVEGKVPVEKLQEATEKMQDVTLDDIKAEAEKRDNPEAKEIVDKIDDIQKENAVAPEVDKTHQELADLETEAEKPMSPEAKEILSQKITEKRDEITAQAHDEIDSHINDSVDQVDAVEKNDQVAELDTRIDALKGDLETSDNEVVKQSLNDRITELESQKGELKSHVSKETKDVLSEKESFIKNRTGKVDRPSDAPTKEELSQFLGKSGEPGYNVEVGKKLLPGGKELSDENISGAYEYITYRNEGGELKGVLEVSYYSDKTGERMKDPQNIKIFVDKDSRRQGIGRGLFSKAKESGIELDNARGKFTTEDGAALYYDYLKNKKPDSKPIEVKAAESASKVGGKLRDKSFITRMAKESSAPEGVKDEIEKKGLKYAQFGNDAAQKISDTVVDDFKKEYGEDGWHEAAVNFASQKKEGVPLSINAGILGRVIGDFIDREKASETPEDKLHFAERAADVANVMDVNARDFGRFGSMLAKVYEMTPLGVEARIKKKIDVVNDAKLDKSFKGRKTDREKIKEVYDELEKLKGEIDTKIKEGVDKAIEEKGQTERRKKADKAIAALSNIRKKIKANSYSSVIPPDLIELGIQAIEQAIDKGTSIIDAVEAGINKIKEHYKDKWSEDKFRKDMLEGFEEEGIETEMRYVPDELIDVSSGQGEGIKIQKESDRVKKTEDQKVKEKALTKGAKSSLFESQEKVMDRIFPKKRMESATKRKKLHEKILEAYNAGALDYEKFEKLFYDKFGLTDVDNGQVKEYLAKKSERIHNAVDGGLKEREYTDVLNFLEDRKKQRLSEWATSPFYANILSGYETHLNNAQFNIFSTMGQMAMLEAKNPRHAAFLGMKLINAFKQSLKEGGNVVMTGQRFGESAKAESLAERRADKGPGISHYYKLPTRLLRAGDVIFNTPIRAMKRAELLLNIADAYNKSLPEGQRLSKTEIQASVNDIMYDTTERKTEAYDQAVKDIQKLEGKDVDLNDPKIAKSIEMRQFEIMEKTRPKDKYLEYGIDYDAVDEQAQDFSDRSLLQRKPIGTLGAVSTFLHNIGDGVPMTKFALTTFVDVPLNLTNMMIDKSPLAFVRMGMYELTGQRGYFVGDEFAQKNNIKTDLTPDQKKEAYIRAITYTSTLAGAAVLAYTKYTDEKGRERNILEVTADGTGDYRKNRSIQKAHPEYEEYTADFMGYKFHYKYNSILAPILTPIGAVKDYERYRDKNPEAEKQVVDRVAFGLYSHLAFTFDQANLQGFRDIFAITPGKETGEDNWSDKSRDYFAKSGGKILRNMLVPNFTIQANKDVKGLLGLSEKKITNAMDYFIKDVPFVESMLTNKIDHLGRNVLSQASLPIMFVPDKLNLKGEDPYYKLMLAHDYYPRFATKKVVFDGKDEVNLTEDQMNVLNKKRGEYVLKALESKSEIKGQDYMETLRGLDDKDFAQEMNKLFKEGEDKAKSEIMGLDVEKKLKADSKEKQRERKLKGIQRLEKMWERLREKE